MKHGRRDTQHQTIRDGLRSCGYFVVDLADKGQGCPDLLVISGCGDMTLMEVKSPGCDLTPEERLFFAVCPAPVAIVHDLTEAVMLLRADAADK